MIVEQLRVDAVKNIITNTYIVCDNSEAIVIDPGGEPNKIIEKLNELGCILKYIVITHCHADHIGGVAELKKAKGGKILISIKDSKGVNNPLKNMAPFVGSKILKIEVDNELKENDIIEVGNEKLRIIETPGHTNGGICIYSETKGILFSGDTIFEGTYGRTDLPSGSYLDIMTSIKNKLMILPDETVIYPGHGKPTNIKAERKNYE